MKLKKTSFMSQLPTAYDAETAMAEYVMIGDDDPAGIIESDTVVLRRTDQNVAELVAYNRAEEKRRKITLVLTGVGVLFAAVKLGFIAIPHIRSWRER